MNTHSPYHALTIGDKAPNVVCAVIEIPKGSHNKYEYDEKTGLFGLDRVLFSPMHYPLDYGFIPETRSEDGDHLDILVIGGDPTFTGCVCDVRPIAVLTMIDSGEPDFKVLGVQAKNPRLDHIKNLKDIEAANPHLLKEIAHFFQVYKDLQGKKVEIGEWYDVSRATEEIERAQKMFQEKG